MRKAIALLFLSALVLSGCAGTSSSAGNAAAPDAVSAATEKRYREGELREYDGERLDPAVGPGDNSIKGVQTVNMDTYRLTIDGLADTPQSYTYDEVTALPGEERLLRLYCVEGWNANILWKGVPLKTLLEAAEPHAEANTIIFHAVDGYTTSMPLQEILDHNLILAYDANGIALPPELGYPFIFVAEDKWGYKWARWVNRIELSSDDSYQGYWESNGYSNSADLGKPSR